MRVLTLHQGVGDRVDTVEDDSTYNRNVRTEVPESPIAEYLKVASIASSSQTLPGETLEEINIAYRQRRRGSWAGL